MPCRDGREEYWKELEKIKKDKLTHYLCKLCAKVGRSALEEIQNEYLERERELITSCGWGQPNHERIDYYFTRMNETTLFDWYRNHCNEDEARKINN